jgi:hypothetical protein
MKRQTLVRIDDKIYDYSYVFYSHKNRGLAITTGSDGLSSITHFKSGMLLLSAFISPNKSMLIKILRRVVGEFHRQNIDFDKITPEQLINKMSVINKILRAIMGEFNLDFQSKG